MARRTVLVVEIDHGEDTHPGWFEGDWNGVELREYIEHEGVRGITKVITMHKVID